MADKNPYPIQIPLPLSERCSMIQGIDETIHELFEQRERLANESLSQMQRERLFNMVMGMASRIIGRAVAHIIQEHPIRGAQDG